MTGYLRIGGAFLLGVILILAAFYVANRKPDEVSNTVASIAPGRSYITPSDANGNGIPDWEEGLSDRVFDAINIPAGTETSIEREPYEAPTTLTGKFAEAFFTDYLAGKVNGGDLENRDVIVSNALSAIEANTVSKIYTRTDIRIVPDSDVAIREYGNQIARIIARHSINNENEAVIVKRALDTNNPAELEKLVPIKTVYENFLQDAKYVATPESLAGGHMALLTACTAILTDITAMQQIFTDPLYALARVKRYQDDATGMYEAFKMIGSVFKARGIIYARDEAGIFFNTIGV